MLCLTYMLRHGQQLKCFQVKYSWIICICESCVHACVVNFCDSKLRQWTLHASDKKYITDLEYIGKPAHPTQISSLSFSLGAVAYGAQGSRPFPLLRQQRPTLKNSLSSSRAATIEGIMLALKTHTHNTHKECPKQRCVWPTSGADAAF